LRKCVASRGHIGVHVRANYDDGTEIGDFTCWQGYSYTDGKTLALFIIIIIIRHRHLHRKSWARRTSRCQVVKMMKWRSLYCIRAVNVWFVSQRVFYHVRQKNCTVLFWQ